MHEGMHTEMNKDLIRDFFDRCAPSWDAEMIRYDDVIGQILDMGEITSDVSVLDVACGTGVLIPDYLQRGVSHVTGVDLSPEMIRIAKQKFEAPGQLADERVELLCGDIETVELGRKFDRCMVYNAFPHFPDPQRLISALAGHLSPGGRLTIAHGMSRAAINHHHEGGASKVSMGLLHEEELAELFQPLFDVDHCISNERMYIVSGKLK